MTFSAPIRAAYDRAADTLYVSRDRERASRGVEDANGLVWRYAADGHVVGVTIMDYSERSSAERSAIKREVGAELMADPEDLDHALRHAAGVEDQNGS